MQAKAPLWISLLPAFFINEWNYKLGRVKPIYNFSHWFS